MGVTPRPRPHKLLMARWAWGGRGLGAVSMPLVCGAWQHTGGPQEAGSEIFLICLWV